MNKKLVAIFVSFMLVLTFITPKVMLAESNETIIDLEEEDKLQSQDSLENNEGNEDIESSEPNEVNEVAEESEMDKVAETNIVAEADESNGTSESNEATEVIESDVEGEVKESNEVDNSNQLDKATEMNISTQAYKMNKLEEKSVWQELVEKVELVKKDAETIINIDKDIEADLEKDSDFTIIIKEGQNIVLKGNGNLKGFGFNSIKVEKGGSLTIDGPIITNSQIIVEGKLHIKSGQILNTKLEGPTIFVNSGELTISDGQIIANEALIGENPKPESLTKTGDSYNYAPITLYGGTLNISGGKISNNKGFLRGGVIGAWGTEASKVNVKILGGEITENKAEHPRFYAFGGAIYLDKANFEMTDGNISKNITEKGGAIALIESNAKISGGSISENSNGEYKGYGGALFISDSNYEINGGHFSNNATTQSGGFLAAYGTSKGTINAGLFENNSSQGFWGGGAIYNDTHCKLTINRALIKENTFKENFLIGANNRPISRQGGGVWNCPTGHTEINITNGLAMYDNSAPNFANDVNNGAGDDFVNITQYRYGEAVGSSSVKLAPRMLGGGYRLWYQDGSFYSIHSNWPKEEQTPRYNPENPGEPLPYNTVITERKGAQLAYKSVPSQESKNLAEQVATSIFRNNTAQGTGISGGAIANNGKLIFGEDKPYNIKITKSWSGDDETTRPEEIVLQMYVGNHYIEDIKLTKDENWAATIKDFPDPDTLVDNKTGEILPINFIEKDSGKYILFEVSKEKDSEQSIYSIELENSIKTSIKVNKVWDDNNNEAGVRPNSITVALFANGENTGKKLELNQDNNWEGTFENLPSHKNGEIIKYTVEEIEVIENYLSSVEGDVENGFTVKNTYIPPQTPPEKVSVSAVKIWKDKNDAAGKRPKEITVNLYKNGELFKTRKISEKDDWKVTFEDLDKYEDGKEIEYIIGEDIVPGYIGELSGDMKTGFVLTNTIYEETPPEKVSVSVVKVWEDKDNASSKRPKEITVNLYKNGELFKIRKVTGKDDWKVTFENLDKYEDGKEIKYTISEGKVAGYTSKISGNAKDGFVLTNTIKPEIPPQTPPEKPRKPRKQRNPKTGDDFSSIYPYVLVLSIISLAYISRRRTIDDK